MNFRCAVDHPTEPCSAARLLEGAATGSIMVHGHRDLDQDFVPWTCSCTVLGFYGSRWGEITASGLGFV